jgi:hypothetical protein
MTLELGASIREHSLLGYTSFNRHGRQARRKPGLRRRIRLIRDRLAAGQSGKKKYGGENNLIHLPHPLLRHMFIASLFLR